MSLHLRWLPGCLRDAGYTPEALKQLLGAVSPDDVGVLNYAPALERAAVDRLPPAVLARLFFLEAAEPRQRVAAALSPRRCQELLDIGLLRPCGRMVEAQQRIDPVGDQYFLADRRFRAARRRALRLPAGDPVYPPSSDSLLLRDVIAAPPARRLLDLCTGSGVQALQRAHLAERMIAVDINPRAAAMARLNAEMNAADHFEARVGDLYRTVGSETFDLIIANPPFVASPHRSGPSYHPGGPRGDRVLRRVIAGWSTRLEDGGRAFAVSHVALRRGEELSTVAHRWFRGFDGRALVVSVALGTPIDLAAAQSLFALDRGLRAYAAEVRRWVSYLWRRRIASVVAILVAAERRAPGGIQVVDAPGGILPIPLGPSPAERISRWLNSSGQSA
jgi:carbamoyltransferase